MKIFYLISNIIEHNIIDINNIYYFDNNSTTLIYDNNVKKIIMDWISCGNPSNVLHDLGQKAKDKIEECRNIIAKYMKILPNELYFTSGATESNNLAIHGIIEYYLENNSNDKYTIITSSFEHPSVLNIFKHYEDHKNINVIYIDPCSNQNSKYYGSIDPNELINHINKLNHKVIMVSIMHANNESGSIQNIKDIGKICKKNNIFFHCDTTQSFGKYLIKPYQFNINCLSFSGHKFHGPKGIGGIFIDHKYNKLINLCYGGEQERHKRPGTENVANIVGMTVAYLKVHENRKEKNKMVRKLSDYILNRLNETLDVDLLGPIHNRLPNTLFILIKNLGTCNKKLVKKLNERKIYVSVGSACQTGKTSHVLRTLNIKKNNYKKVIRISLSDYTTKKQCDYLINNLIDLIKNSNI